MIGQTAEAKKARGEINSGRHLEIACRLIRLNIAPALKRSVFDVSPK